jgi:transposase
MRGPYPGELRIRAIDFVEAGGSRCEAAEQFQVSVSSAIRWVQRFREHGTSEPMPRGGSTSPLENYSQPILPLIREQRDLTLNELVSLLRKDVSVEAAAHCPEQPHRCPRSSERCPRSFGVLSAMRRYPHPRRHKTFQEAPKWRFRDPGRPRRSCEQDLSSSAKKPAALQ